MRRVQKKAYEADEEYAIPKREVHAGDRGITIYVSPEEYELLKEAARLRETTVLDLMQHAAQQQMYAPTEHFSPRQAELFYQSLSAPQRVLLDCLVTSASTLAQLPQLGLSAPLSERELQTPRHLEDTWWHVIQLGQLARNWGLHSLFTTDEIFRSERQILAHATELAAACADLDEAEGKKERAHATRALRKVERRAPVPPKQPYTLRAAAREVFRQTIERAFSERMLTSYATGDQIEASIVRILARAPQRICRVGELVFSESKMLLVQRLLTRQMLRFGFRFARLLHIEEHADWQQIRWTLSAEAAAALQEEDVNL